jgi:homoserine kinase
VRGAFHITLPASAANLGPAFDTAALALQLRLRITARLAAPGGEGSLAAAGRDGDICGRREGHLVLDTYQRTLAQAGRPAPALALRIANEIPIGKGLGSSAAARLAGLALASHFGGLEWDAERVFQEAARLEGHPDNAAACWWGGLAVAGGEPPVWLSVPLAVRWPVLAAIPPSGLATETARAILPASYTRADAVVNLQREALLLHALAQGRGDLLAQAMSDRLHQPYRAAACPLLPALLPLAGREGILGCALSGAGPSVLMILCNRSSYARAEAAAEGALTAAGLRAELLRAAILERGPGLDWNLQPRVGRRTGR